VETVEPAVEMGEHRRACSLMEVINVLSDDIHVLLRKSLAL
jgi:hypothetical protein